MTKRAFTLVELLVVAGIMAAMATVSIGSYFAVVRGMADRGALGSATSVISLAQERARIDATPTVVYFYNEMVQLKNDANKTDAVVCGMAVAVRRAGRISRVDGDLLCDEYSDLERTYGVADNPNSINSDTFRLYRFNLQRMEYASVYSEVAEAEIDNEKYFAEKPQDRSFVKPSGRDEDASKMLVYAFLRKNGFGGWRAGDAYGYEFARVRLPDNYIFGTTVPTDSSPVVAAGVVRCFPDSNASSLENVTVYARRPNGWVKVGDSKREMKDI